MKKNLFPKCKLQGTKHNLKKSHHSIVSLFLCAFVFYLLPSLSSAQQWYQASFGGQILYDITFTSPDTGYVVGAAGTIRKTTDAGNTWNNLTSGTTQYLWSVFFTDANTGYVAGENGYILKTSDAGATWDSLTSGLGFGDHLTSVFFTDANTGYVAGRFGYIRKTTDAGLTWNPQSSGTSSNWEHIYFNSISGTGYAVGAGATIKYTNNGGSFWQSPSNVSSTNLLYSVAFADDNKGAAVGINGTILKCIDGGLYWDPVTSGTTAYLLDIKFLNANTAYISGGSGTILKTADGGVSWSSLVSGTTEDLNAIYFTDANTGYAIGTNGIILKTCNLTANAGNDTTICSGTSATIGGTPVATGGTTPYSYSWAPSNSLSASNVENPVATPGSYTVYSLTVTDNNGCTATDSMNMYVAASPIAAIPSVSHVTCNGGNNGTLSGTANGGTTPYTFTWSNGSTGTTVGGLIAGTYILTITGGNACIDTESVTITEPPAINISVSQTNVSCNGGNDGTATANVTGGTPAYTYTWTSGFTTIGTAASISGLAGGNYTINVTDANNCNASANVTITQPPVFSGGISSTDVSCFGGNDGTATASGTGGTTPYSFVWFNGSTAQTLTNLAAGTYSVTVSDANGCGNLQYSATINEPSTALTTTTSSADVTCNGGTDGSITANPSGGTAPYSYQWSDAQFQTAQTATGLVAATYTVTVTDANFCTYVDTAYIAEPSAVTADAGTYQEICEGNSAFLNATANGGTGSFSFIWPGIGTGPSLAVTPSVTTLYSVSVTDANGCSGTDTVTVIVNSNSIAPTSISASANPVCSGTSITLTQNGGALGTGASYIWYSASCGGTFSGTGNSVSVAPSSTATYYVRAEGTCNTTSCTSVTVNVNSNPNPTITPSGSTTFCAGGNVILDAGSFTSYIWSTGATSQTITVSSSGNYNVTVTDGNGCSGSSDTVAVTVNPNPDAAINPVSPLCTVDPPIALTAATGGGTFSGTGVSGSTFDPAVAGAGTHTVVYSVTVNGCTSSDSVFVVVNASADATINPVGPFCASDSPMNLTAAQSGGTWSGTGITNFATGTFDPAVAGGGTHTITYTIGGGCGGTDTETITVNPNPVADAGADQSICIGDSTQLSASGGTIYVWTPANTLTDDSIANPIAFPSDTTIYLASIVDANGCTGSDNVTIFVNQLPVVDAVPDTVINQGGMATLTATGGISYSWSTTETTPSINVSPNSTNSYYVIGTDSNGCENIDSVTVFVVQIYFSINGTIYNQAQDTTLNNGTVYLFPYDSLFQLAPVDSFLLGGANGDYVFNNELAGQYIILFRPDNGIYPDAIPTYFGDTTNWDGAQILNLISDTTGIDISTREVPQLIGSGTVSGLIQFGIGSGKTGNGTVIPFGDPVPGIDINLEQVPGGIVKHTTTNDSGIYSFTNLPLGYDYKIFVDIPGLPMDSTYTVNLTSTDSVVSNLDYVVDTASDGSAGIYIGYPQGTSDLRLTTYDFLIFPNPNDGKFTIQMMNDEVRMLKYEVKIYNVLGEIVYTKQRTTSNEQLTTNLPQGIYNVQIHTGNEIINRKIIVK